jgi:hypothetical protein
VTFIVVSNTGGFTRPPSAVIVVVCFASLATRVVARWGFRRGDD